MNRWNNRKEEHIMYSTYELEYMARERTARYEYEARQARLVKLVSEQDGKGLSLFARLSKMFAAVGQPKAAHAQAVRMSEVPCT